MIPLPLGCITGIEAEVIGPAGGLPVSVGPDLPAELAMPDPPTPLDREPAVKVIELPAGAESDSAEDEPGRDSTLGKVPEPARVYPADIRPVDAKPVGTEAAGAEVTGVDVKELEPSDDGPADAEPADAEPAEVKLGMDGPRLAIKAES